MKALKIAGAAIAAVIVVLVLFLIIGIPSGFLTSQIQARVERETGYRLTISGSTKIGIWPALNVTLNDITLEAPKDHDGRNRFTVGSIRADVALGSVWSGHPQITELSIVRPVMYGTLLRERTRVPAPPARPAASGEPQANAVAIDRVTITDGAMVLSNTRDRVERHIDGINVSALIGGDRKIKITGSARASEQPVKFDIRLTAPPLERQNFPLELTFEAPSLLQAPLSARAEARLNGTVVMINGVTGTLGDAAFTGWASVDAASKPLVKLDLDFQRLDLAASRASGGSPAAQQPSQQLSQQAWSNATIDLNEMNYIDAQVRISAAELDIGEVRFAPASIDATLASGVLKASFPNLQAYGGQVTGQLTVDMTTGSPTYAFASDLVGVRALPLLQSAAGFDKLDGKLQAKLVLRSAGNSQRAVMSNLGGIVFANFQDGAIKGLNIAQMIRSLTSGTLSGWQEGKEQTTDLSQLSVSVKIDKGLATSNDLNLVGPLVRVTGAGTIDLAAKTLAFRVEPKLVMTTEGQGRAADPVGLGIPVVIDGPWSEPRIYPEMNGILDNPDAAYAKLKEMGKGLFGPGGGLSGLGGLGGLGSLGGSPSGGSGSGDSGSAGTLGETLGNLLQQGLGRKRDLAPLPPPAPVAPPPAAHSDPAPQAPQDSQPMNDVLRNLFSR
jgi:AsmA protein